jgi:hypothetical protein
MAVGEAYNATITLAVSVIIGFTRTYMASNGPPASFSVNGTAC